MSFIKRIHSTRSQLTIRITIISNMFSYYQQTLSHLVFNCLISFVTTFLLSYYRTCLWVNPAAKHLVVVSSSDGRNIPYGNQEDILSRDVKPCNCHTKDNNNSWFAVDMGVWFSPTCYTLRHSKGYGKYVIIYNCYTMIPIPGSNPMIPIPGSYPMIPIPGSYPMIPFLGHVYIQYTVFL